MYFFRNFEGLLRPRNPRERLFRRITRGIINFEKKLILGCWGDPARGIPTLLDPVQAKEHHAPGTPIPPSSRDPLSGRDPPPPLAPLWEGARGKGSWLEMRLLARGFLEPWALWAWAYHERRVPPTSRDPFPKDPSVLKTVCVVNLLSVVNLLRVVIQYWKSSESLHFEYWFIIIIIFFLSSESLCVVNSLRSSKTLRNRTLY